MNEYPVCLGCSTNKNKTKRVGYIDLFLGTVLCERVCLCIYSKI